MREPRRQVDWGYLARGASTGFTVLFFAGLLFPLVARYAPIGAVVGLIVVAVSGFAVAGWRIGEAAAPALHGSASAVLAYVLVVPLILITDRETGLAQWGLTALAAAAVGGAAGYVAGGIRSRCDDGSRR